MQKKLHILFLCGWYPSKVLPNNGDFIQRHAEAVSLKHRVSVLHIISDKNCDQKIKIVTQQINNVETHIAYLKPTKNKIVKVYKFWKAYKLLIKKIDPIDLVHLNEIYPFGIFALHLKAKKKIPYVISEHWSGYKTSMIYKINIIQKTITKKITKESTFILPISKDLGKSMKKQGFKGNYEHVPNVVDTYKFIPTNNKEEVFTIVHISNMIDEYKNISGIIRVVKKLESKIDLFKIKLIGAKPKNLILKIEKEGLSSKVEFIDYLPQEEMIVHLQKAHLLLMFSNQENLPCTILEAFSCGIPVISTNVGGIPEYFPKEFGFLVNPNDEEVLLEKILHLYRNPIDLKEKMHQYAVNNFSRHKISELFSSIYYKSIS